MNRLGTLVLCFAAVCAAARPADDRAPSKLEYNRDVRPILSDKCFKCHGPDSPARKSDLRLDLRDSALAEHDSGRAIIPGNPEQSELVRRIQSTDADDQMPPPKSNLRLSKDEITVLRNWIAEGAAYEPHWSLARPKAAQLPSVRRTDWPRNGIDWFVLARLEHEGFSPAPEADKTTLLRGNGCIPRGLRSRCFRARRGSPARLAALRRTHGYGLARCCALRGLEWLLP
jgi:hypothetical protein